MSHVILLQDAIKTSYAKGRRNGIRGPIPYSDKKIQIHESIAARGIVYRYLEIGLCEGVWQAYMMTVMERDPQYMIIIPDEVKKYSLDEMLAWVNSLH